MSSPPPEQPPKKAAESSSPSLVDGFLLHARAYFIDEPPTFFVALAPLVTLSVVLFSRNPKTTNYIFDEQEALLANPYVNADYSSMGVVKGFFHAIKQAFLVDFWGLPHTRSIGSYRPVPNLLWRALWQVTTSTFWHDCINIFLHATSGALLVMLVYRLTRRRGTAWIAGTLFTACAVLTEAVSGIVGIADILAGLAAILCLSALLLPLWAMPFAVFAGMLLGLFSKESALVCVPLIPFAALLIAPLTHPKKPLRALRCGLALVATVGAFVLYVQTRKTLYPAPMEPAFKALLPASAPWYRRGMRVFLHWYHAPPLPKDPLNNPLINATPKLRIAGGLRVYFRGLGQVIFPHTLSGDYSSPQEPVPTSLTGFESVAGLFLMVFPLFASVALWVRSLLLERRLRQSEGVLDAELEREFESPPSRWTEALGAPILLALGFTWVVVAYFPLSNIPILLPTVRAERFWYLPALGTSMALAYFFAWFHKRARGIQDGVLGVAVFTVFLTFQAGSAFRHSRDYRDDLAFWDAARRSSPNSAKAHLNYSVMEGARGRMKVRIASNRVALKLAPSWPMAHVYLGDALCRDHRPTEAWPHFKKGFVLAKNNYHLLALGLQCMWDENEVDEDKRSVRSYHLREAELQRLADAHKGSWLAYLVNDMANNADKNKGVDPKYRPRSYNAGPKKEK